MLDPDLVRVDLLRVKRMMYKSFPDGSQAQKDFLLSAKKSEIKYLSALVSPEITDLVFDNYKKELRFELIDIWLCLGIGASLSVMGLGFHQLYPKSIFFKLFVVPIIVGIFLSLTHVWHIVEQWKKMQPIKKDYLDLTKRIEKLNKELGNLK